MLSEDLRCAIADLRSRARTVLGEFADTTLPADRAIAAIGFGPAPCERTAAIAWLALGRLRVAVARAAIRHSDWLRPSRVSELVAPVVTPLLREQLLSQTDAFIARLVELARECEIKKFTLPEQFMSELEAIKAERSVYRSNGMLVGWYHFIRQFTERAEKIVGEEREKRKNPGINLSLAVDSLNHAFANRTFRS